MAQKVQDVADYIVSWMDKHLDEVEGITGLVVGVSGGVDSALTSTLCALTGRPVLAVTMPIHQHDKENARAEHHLKWLASQYSCVKTQTIPLSDTFDTMKQALSAASCKELALANTQARLRMSVLYAVAGSNRMLVCGTGNRVEDFGVGFFTKYGDGGVDISPIAGLMKTEVYRLAEHLGVHQEILQASPTDGLWADGRNDEDQIGATYAELEWAMEFDGEHETLSGRQAEVYELYNRLNRLNAHKMHPIPVCEIPAQMRVGLSA